ncbi:UDP-N-acetylglucosamine 2-epimerase [Pantoea sp. C8B4]|uniref:UDP-N-acetylglucosamine 2-epimerase n=1 Tax=Pantoea sp. C8B4 TaxID=3243083 RepID=UPI003EDA042B
MGRHWRAGGCRCGAGAPSSSNVINKPLKRSHVKVLTVFGTRPEAIKMAPLVQVGTDINRIVKEVSLLLQDEDVWQRMSRAHNPYGDGQACSRILQALKQHRV